MRRFEGRTVLVTGAARGQGAAAARLFAEEGAEVLGTDVLDEEGEATATRLGEAGHRARYRHLDVAEPSQWEAVVGGWIASTCSSTTPA